jgi:hypothetical protein
MRLLKGKKTLIFRKSYLFTTKVTEEERNEKLNQEVGLKLKELEKKKGFRRVFEALANKKVFIGHNCIIDLFFTISHFGDQLPNTLTEMKTLMKDYFQM